MTLFPENKMVAQGPWDVEWMYYPKQQQCAMDIMEVMETNGEFCLLLSSLLIYVCDYLLIVAQSQ